MATSAASSLFSVAGKNVLVTGGSRGIGEMIAKGFSQAGANVLLTSRDENACRETAAAITAETQHQCHYVTSSLSSREGCEKLAEYVGRHFDNKLHVLVNNAGTSWGECELRCLFALSPLSFLLPKYLGSSHMVLSYHLFLYSL
jgi:NAD(P)-dependent dehydrogenase (short-subunit alcohol dehydrogenase family)